MYFGQKFTFMKRIQVRTVSNMSSQQSRKHFSCMPSQKYLLNFNFKLVFQVIGI